MVIDIHTHSFPPSLAGKAVANLSGVAHIRPHTDGTATGLRASMARAGVDVSVLLPVAMKAKHVPGLNDSAAGLNEGFPASGLLSFGAIHPDCPDWREELDRMAALGLKGLKLHPAYQLADQDDIRYLRILERAGELGLVVVTHGGIDVGYPELDHCAPAKIRNALRQVGPVKFVTAHMGGWKCWEEAAALLADTGAYLDTSFSTGSIAPPEGDAHYSEEEKLLLDEERFMEMVKLFGSSRILYGSDSPWSDQAASIAWLGSLPLEDGELQAILGGNAQKLLGL